MSEYQTPTSEGGQVDATAAADETYRNVEQQRVEASRTVREQGLNSRGEPTVYPSDVEAVARQHNLTTPEAEQLLTEGNVTAERAAELKAGRVVYRVTYEQVPAVMSPLAQADARAAAAAADAEAATSTTPTPDATQPEAGPYGPHADYREAEVTAEEVAQQAGVTVDAAAQALDTTQEG